MKRNLSSGGLPAVWKSRVVVLVGFLLLLYVVLPHIGSFADSWQILVRARFAPLLLASGFVAATYCFAAGVYVMLAHRTLRFVPTLSVQVSTAFTNRLLPAGLGGLTLYVAYLRKTNHTMTQSVAIAATNNALGIVAHMLLLTATFRAGDTFVMGYTWRMPALSGLGLALAGMAILAVSIISINRLRHYALHILRQLQRYAAGYRRHPARVAVALLYAMAVTICHVAALYFCTRAVGIAESFWVVFVVFTAGTLAGTVTPTPGGLGGVEAGLAAALIAYGVDASAALAAVLLYRLLTYWLLLGPGFITFLAIRKRWLTHLASIA